MPKRKGAGKYTEYIQFIRMPKPPVLDAIGGEIGVPVHHFYSYAAFEPAGSDEFFVAHKRHSEATARFRIPYQEITIDPALHQIVLTFDETASPPNVSTWNVLGAYGDRFEITIEVTETR